MSVSNEAPPENYSKHLKVCSSSEPPFLKSLSIQKEKIVEFNFGEKIASVCNCRYKEICFNISLFKRNMHKSYIAK